MKLSGEQFQQIVSQLTSDGPQKGQHEQRHEPRVGIRAQGFVSPWTLDESDAEQIRVTIRDLSQAGICIVSTTPMPRGARFVLRLLRDKQKTLLVHYEVRHCREMAPALFSIGAKLVNVSDASGEPVAA